MTCLAVPTRELLPDRQTDRQTDRQRAISLIATAVKKRAIQIVILYANIIIGNHVLNEVPDAHCREGAFRGM